MNSAGPPVPVDNGPSPTARKRPSGGAGIARRVALLAWLVSLGTLVVFVAATLPEEKRIFQQNLESKARGIAVSLQEIVVGAAVSEDYGSVVDHCLQLLKGDPSVSRVVITRNDGFSLITERSGWRADTLGANWRPAERTSRWTIGANAQFQYRGFQYSQPLDYSGLEWGWIHVGLSLDAYDGNLRRVYFLTGIFGVLCAVFSLVASLVYARKLVRPILTLRTTVQRVAEGDLAARAPTDRTDELGSLARSFNSMTDALLRRDRILASVQYAARQFLGTADWRTVIGGVLSRLGDATAVSRILILEARPTEGGGARLSTPFEWMASGISSRKDGAERSRRAEDSPCLRLWLEALARGDVVEAAVRGLSAVDRECLGQDGIRSLLMVPIMVDGTWWGALSLDDCRGERQWTGPERDSLHAAADMLGSAIARKRAQDALVDAKETLERRVDERTIELREQVAAKERVLADLAEAQQRLVAASRQAGMAEVATGVLHNVGNVLNSVNVSANLVRERLAGSRVAALVRASDLMQAQGDALAAFLAQDPRGRNIPAFVIEVSGQLAGENRTLVAEVGELSRNIEHIKEIVGVQQSYARAAGVIEHLPPGELIEDAVRMNQSSLLRHGVALTRDLDTVPPAALDRHKTLQILVNLLSNAIHAVKPRPVEDRWIRLQLKVAGDRIRFTVEDNGTGIAPGNLVRIFSHGFTTRKDGHGFGLHSGALTARSLGGSLHVASQGTDQGATFTLELPFLPAAQPGRQQQPPSAHVNGP